MRLLPIVFAAGLFLHNVSAVTLVTYDFNSLTGNASTVASGLSASALTGSNLTFPAGIGNPGGAASSTGWNTSSIDLTHFLSFTITPQGSLNLTTFQLDFSQVSSGPNGMQVSYVINGTESLLLQSPVPSGGYVGGTQYFNLTISSPVTFRIYAWSASSASGALLLDNITLSGTSTVPEPGVYALLGLAVVCGVPSMRRRS